MRKENKNLAENFRIFCKVFLFQYDICVRYLRRRVRAFVFIVMSVR
jgi:hypothetical protein